MQFEREWNKWRTSRIYNKKIFQKNYIFQFIYFHEILFLIFLVSYHSIYKKLVFGFSSRDDITVISYLTNILHCHLSCEFIKVTLNKQKKKKSRRRRKIHINSLFKKRHKIKPLKVMIQYIWGKHINSSLTKNFTSV